MALDFTKVVYIDGTTVIYAANLNAIQDALLWLDEHKQDALTIDDTVTEGSANPVTGGAVYLAISAEDTALRELLAGKLASVAFAPAYSETGTYADGDYCTQMGIAYRCTTPIAVPEVFNAAHWAPVTVVELTEELQEGKQDKLTFDDTPTAGSSNPVKSGGIASELADKASAIYETSSGSVASFADGADGLPCKSIVAQVTPIQAGSGDPSPENVRAIIGWAALALTRCGKNMLNPAGIAQGSISQTGRDTVSSSRCRSGFVAVHPGETYAASVDAGKIITAVHYYRYMQAGTGAWISRDANNSNSAIFTAPANCTAVRLVFAFADDTTDIAPSDITNAMLERGGSASAYEVFSGSVYNVSFGEAGTAYGGVLNVLTGVLTVTNGMVDLGSLDWSYISSNAYFRANMPSDCITSTSYGRNGYCERYKVIQGTNDYFYNSSYALIYCSTNLSSSKRVYIKDDGYTDPDDFKTAVTGTKLVYLLAEPVTYQLTPTEVDTLLGTNAIWANTGNVAVTYPADTKMYIDAQIAAVMAAMSEE